MLPIDIAAELVHAINGHDVPALAALMTQDHELVDALDNAVRGRDAVAQAWQMYFDIVTDYELAVDTALASADVVALFGRARGRTGSAGHQDRWDIPWACRAEVREQRVASWRIYCDNEPARRSLARTAAAAPRAVVVDEPEGE